MSDGRSPSASPDSRKASISPRTSAQYGDLVSRVWDWFVGLFKKKKQPVLAKITLHFTTE